MLAVRRARFADAVALAASLRVEDALELSAAWPVPPAEGLIYCLLRSDRAFAVTTRDRPLALWGVTDTAGGGLELGVPWLLAAPALFRRRRELVARSRNWVARLLLDYDALLNVTDAANVTHLRWLEWCGFEALRDRPRFGRLGRTYREFYRVNARRHPAASGVRELLLGRPVPSPAPLSGPLTRLVRLARGALDDPAGLPALIEALPVLLPAIAAEALPARTRSGVLALLLEVAGRAELWGSAERPRPSVSITLGGRWCSALAATADAAALRDSGPAVTEVLTAPRRDLKAPRRDLKESRRDLKVPRRDLKESRRDLANEKRRDSTTPRGNRLLPVLAEAYLRALTFEGRLDPVAGYRVHRAAAGGEGRDDVAPGCSRRDLLGAFLPLRLCRVEEHAAGMAALSEAARAPVTAGGLERLRRALPEGSPFARALAGTIDQWGPFARPVQSLGDACRVAGAMADAAAGLMLPTLASHGISAGVAERHAVYRVIRGQLLTEAVAGDGRRLCRLLAAEVAALLTAAAFDDALLSLPGAGRKAPRDGQAVTALGRVIGQIWGPLSAPNLAAVLALLLPVLSVPAVHGRQLAPALLVWHLTETDRLESLLSELGEVFRCPERDPRQRCSRVLRRWQRALDIVAFRRHLESHGNQRSADRPFDRDPAGGAVPP